MPATVVCHIDLKSPFAYLALESIDALPCDFDVSLDWRFFNLDLARFVGAPEQRDARGQRRVKYSYMDARRLAAPRGLVIKGPKKLFDSRPAGMGLLWAADRGGFTAYRDAAFQRFFNREFAVDEPDAVAALLKELGIATDGFTAFLMGDGPRRLEAQQAEAEAAGVFGVPTLVFGGEVFWGGDRVPLLRERLAAAGLKRQS